MIIRKMYQLLPQYICLMLLVVNPAAAQDASDCAVQASAVVQVSPPKISLSWPYSSSGTGYTIYRKSLTDSSFGSSIAALAGNAVGYEDTNVSVGTAYEYQVLRAGSAVVSGYVYSGINVPEPDSWGKVILIVDNTYAADLATELARLQQDLVGEGWTVLRHDVSRTDSVPSVKNIIASEYNNDPANVRSVFLFGHVPVPYSGYLNPDGHGDHRGAWPCDSYYGDIDGTWTDNTNYSHVAWDARNNNDAGDGKFDQSAIPSAVELEVGRVDLYNMPGNAIWNNPPDTFDSELGLLRNYLEKDHKFRTGQVKCQRRAIIADFFGFGGGSAFSGSGYRSFSALIGASEITYKPYESTWVADLQQNDYLWAYGAGGGYWNSAVGLGTSLDYFDTYTDVKTVDVVSGDLKAQFTMMFGSWFGDWDCKDSLLKAFLATPTYGLTCCWSGRPHWYYHHMGLGMPIGYSAKLTMNNGANMYYDAGEDALGEVHIGLMGDPTLRMINVIPCTGLSVSRSGTTNTLTWSASSDTGILGYNIYRSINPQGPYTKVNSSLITALTDTDAGSGTDYYMVRAVKLETTASGTYYNMSRGITAQVGGSSDDPIEPGTFTVSVNSLDFGEVSKKSTKALTFDIASTDSGTISGTVTSGQAWIIVDPATFTGNTTITVIVNPAALDAGAQQTGTITATAGSESKTITVTVTPTCVITYPNPFQLSSCPAMTFSGSGVPGSTIRIYTLTGELVKAIIENAGLAALAWDGNNESGNPVAPGIYIYCARNQIEKNVGRITIIR